MADRYRANYAVVSVLEHLGPSPETLGIPWAEFTGDRSSRQEFTVPVADVVDPYIELQAYDVSEYGHEILVNDEPLSGFDIPPADGWQYWFDAVTDQELQSGTNTVEVRRDTSTTDAFAVGTLVVHWKEPVE
jgi:hypothetical protein